MKKIIYFFFLILFILPYYISADEYAITDSGKKVLLKDDGTWEYVKETEKSDSLKIKSWRWNNQEIFNWITIEGVVINNTNKTYSNYQIIINAEDADGNYLGNGSSFLEPSTIRPGRTANFSVLITDATCKTKSLNISYQFDKW